MIKKEFTSLQAMQHLDHAITCWYFFEKFIFGKGLYGNRVSLMRSKLAGQLYNLDASFKGCTFHAIEGIKAMELPNTILLTRKKLESFFISREDMLDFLENFKEDFTTIADMEAVADKWYRLVSKKLILNKTTDFALLNKFVIGSMVMLLPINTQLQIAQFRKEQILTLLTQEIISADFAEQALQAMPATTSGLVALKQQILKNQAINKAQKGAAQY